MGAEGLLCGWWSSFLPLLSPISLKNTVKNTNIQRNECTYKIIQSRTHRQLQSNIQRTRQASKRCCANTHAHTHAYARHRHRNQRIKVLLQPGNRFLWHPRTQRQPVLLRSLSECLPPPEVIHPALLQKTRRERKGERFADGAEDGVRCWWRQIQ